MTARPAIAIATIATQTLAHLEGDTIKNVSHSNDKVQLLLKDVLRRVLASPCDTWVALHTPSPHASPISSIWVQ